MGFDPRLSDALDLITGLAHERTLPSTDSLKRLIALLHLYDLVDSFTGAIPEAKSQVPTHNITQWLQGSVPRELWDVIARLQSGTSLTANQIQFLQQEAFMLQSALTTSNTALGTLVMQVVTRAFLQNLAATATSPGSSTGLPNLSNLGALGNLGSLPTSTLTSTLESALPRLQSELESRLASGAMTPGSLLADVTSIKDEFLKANLQQRTSNQILKQFIPDGLVPLLQNYSSALASMRALDLQAALDSLIMVLNTTAAAIPGAVRDSGLSDTSKVVAELRRLNVTLQRIVSGSCAKSACPAARTFFDSLRGKLPPEAQALVQDPEQWLKSHDAVTALAVLRVVARVVASEADRVSGTSAAADVQAALQEAWSVVLNSSIMQNVTGALAWASGMPWLVGLPGDEVVQGILESIQGLVRAAATRARVDVTMNVGMLGETVDTFVGAKRDKFRAALAALSDLPLEQVLITAVRSMSAQQAAGRRSSRRELMQGTEGVLVETSLQGMDPQDSVSMAASMRSSAGASSLQSALAAQGLSITVTSVSAAPSGVSALTAQPQKSAAPQEGQQQGDSSGKSNTGLIVGLVVGIVGGVALIAAVAVGVMMVSRRKRIAASNEGGTGSAPTSGCPSPAKGSPVMAVPLAGPPVAYAAVPAAPAHSAVDGVKEDRVMVMAVPIVISQYSPVVLDSQNEARGKDMKYEI
eukprot:CAMPEP_0202914234 /NCGR_PEP_ID=MMETSP1392-20130828/62580_1 /ASSEMBLY_ACC=CAM_ASM_000868 /TAXON_ID=225041 /ORGANISM="Chlamydomonas chlamydogama, Strain SAG 11-48b" /LENGTH=697 /DNA_ID=CAMNT_0049605811 /DNA_START=1 /DNA_END=2094 /DNA_ORIENTATION=-